MGSVTEAVTVDSTETKAVEVCSLLTLDVIFDEKLVDVNIEVTGVPFVD